MLEMPQMIGTVRRTSLCLLALFAVAPTNSALAQTNGLQGAWLEDGLSCASVFVATRDAVGFKQPPSIFVPAFIIAGRRVSTPLATCRIVAVKSNGSRQIMNLSCTTSVSSGSARAFLAPAPDGGLLRYLSAEDSVATRFQRCDRAKLTARDGGGTTGPMASPKTGPS